MLLPRGWVPHDEGSIAQSAERVLAGELPHRDFDELYTGGLTYLNAVAFRVFGETLLAPRIMLFLFFLAWVPVVYRIAARFTGPLAAGGITLLVVAWSVPNYSAALPSWYNLFFATFGLAAALRFLDTHRRSWLFAAGLCCGCSFLFKLSGLYFAAGMLLFLIFREQELARGNPLGQRPRLGLFSAFIIAGMITFVAALYLLLKSERSAVAIVEFMLPGACLAVLCSFRELAGVPGLDSRRFLSFFRVLWPFLAGTALPVVLFLIPYIHAGAIHDFVNGVFVLPGRRLAFAARRPPGFGLNKILTAVALVALLVAAYRHRLRARWTQMILGLLLIAAFVLSRIHPGIYASIWAPLLLLIPISTVAALAILGSSTIPYSRRFALMLAVSVAATCTLIQLPFSAGIYFCYVAPLLAISLASIFAAPARVSRPILGLLLAFYLAFAVFRVTPGFLYSMGYFYQPDPETTRLQLPRAGGLRVDAARSQEYEELIPVIRAHAGFSDYIYAAPDCPEVYFLAAKRNPTRTLFDFFDDAAGHSQRVLAAIDARDVHVIALYSRPEFSPPIASDLMTTLRERFPQSRLVGQFEVRWRP